MKRAHSNSDEVLPKKMPARSKPAAVPGSAPASADSARSTNLRLMGELKQAMRTGLDPNTNLEMGLVDPNKLDDWYCDKVYTDDPNATVQQKRIFEGLREHNTDRVRYRMRFCKDYPFKPPFVYLHYPHLQGGVNIFPRGGICAQQISQQDGNGWSPALNVKTLMVALTTLPETYSGVHVKPGTYEPHTEEGARKDFSRIEEIHSADRSGWSEKKQSS